jgi:hypothetical protein
MQKLIPLLFVFFIFSCHQQFKKEIPPRENGSYDLKKQKERQLQLDSLESGFNSLQIRIWYDYSLVTKRELIIIKKVKNQWTGMYYKMEVDWNPFKYTETITNRKSEFITPSFGWDNFTKKLFDLKIMTLPNMADIPGLINDWDDGSTYNIEVATKNQYRFYSYHEPDKFEGKYWQAKKIVEILKLVSGEFKRAHTF